MILYSDSSEARSLMKGSCCAFGVFDGCHKGHRFLISQANSMAKEKRRVSLILTFDVDPDELFRHEDLMKLQSNDERIESLESLGADAVIVFRFDKAFASLEPKDFLVQAFGDCEPSDIHVGSNFRFGFHASGSAEDMRKWGSERKMSVHSHKLLKYDDTPISSTRIRNLLKDGDTNAASTLLGGI